MHADAKAKALKKIIRDEEIVLRRVERNKLIEKWMPDSNKFDPAVDGADSGFYVEEFDGFRKRVISRDRALRHPDQYYVIWAPRFYDADVEFSVELPEVRGFA